MNPRLIWALAGTAALALSLTAVGPAGAGSDGGWTVDVDDCVDPDLAEEPIEGTVRIGSVAPLSGGVAAAAFSPVAEGFEAYIDYANENELVPGYTVEVTIGDDQFDAGLTPGVVSGLIDEGVHLFSSIIGTANNLAVRDTLNEECIPQLNAATGDPAWGEIEDYPWTTGILTPYDLESQAYVQAIADNFPDAETAALFTVNAEFGEVYRRAFSEAATGAGLQIVDEQTIEAADTAPPTAQLVSIARQAPDVIMAVPLGAQCPTLMSELANIIAINVDWDPVVFITNTCASPLILAVAGGAADGLYTSAPAGIADTANPDVVAEEPYATYVAEMEARGLESIVTTGAAGWNFADATVEVLRLAAESPDGLTRRSIIEAARRLDYHPMLVRDGMSYIMNGEDDVFYSEDVQVTQYDAEAGFFHDIGEPYSFESS